MDLSNTRTVPAAPAAVWEALNDPAVLAACLPGCESFERTDDGAFKVTMTARVGPVSARFNGRMTMTDVDSPNAYTLHFEGQGGAAGFAKGEARVSLAPSGAAETALTYVAKAQVGGKLAQIGSRLIDGAAAKMADDFFARFAAHLTPPAAEGAGAAETAQASATAAATSVAPVGGKAWIRYAAIIVIVILLILLYVYGKR
ncbi:MAG TPA: carbon monoxide dehydrogenase subunit G [Casimicrobiaceae bacterium]|jgi:carbon monoxide dehydrogenase subunit G